MHILKRRTQSRDGFIVGWVWVMAAQRCFTQWWRANPTRAGDRKLCYEHGCSAECIGNASFENYIHWWRMACCSFFCTSDNDIVIPISCMIDHEFRIRHPFSPSDHSLFQEPSQQTFSQQWSLIDALYLHWNNRNNKPFLPHLKCQLF